MRTFGIDLGTTYSCVATYDEKYKRTDILENSSGQQTTQSVVYLENGMRSVVGKAAVNKLKTGSARNVVEFVKRDIADDSMIERNEFPHYPEINGEKPNPTMISSIILRYLTIENDSVTQLLEKRDEKPKVVITFPAYFSLGAKARTKQAGELAGLEILDMIEEPIAAAISYGFGQDTKNKTVMVYDLGGGTFDVTIVRFDSNGNGVVLAKDGDPRLGGVDWDNAFGFYLWSRFQKECGLKDDLTAEDFQKKSSEIEDIEKLKMINTFRLLAKDGKHDLTTSDEVEIEYKDNYISVTRGNFDDVTCQLMKTTIAMVTNVIKQANLTSEVVDSVLLVGGSSRMPQVKKELEKEFKDFVGKIRVEDPDTAVAKGAAILAHARAQSRLDGGQFSEKIDVPTIVNISSKSYGIKCRDRETGIDYVSILIKRGTQLPAHGENIYWTLEDNQIRCILDIYESDVDNDWVDMDATRLISKKPTLFSFDHPVPAGTKFTVSFEMDEAGLLHGTAKAPSAATVTFELKIDGVMDASQMNTACTACACLEIKK